MTHNEDWVKYNEELFNALLIEENLDTGVKCCNNNKINCNCCYLMKGYCKSYNCNNNLRSKRCSCCNVSNDQCKTCTGCNIIKERCKSCKNKLSSSEPESQYQRLKIIQNTVRVPSSLYSMNIGALMVYQKPGLMRVNWNQMSDRKNPHVQRASMSMKSSVSVRPGNISPGGVGCDIKHNSYNRYIAKIKAKKPLRREQVPSDFGQNIPFNIGSPIYGGKTVKTSIGASTCVICK